MKRQDFLISLYVILLMSPIKVFAVDPTIQNAQDQLQAVDWSLGRAGTGRDGIFLVLNDIIDRLPFYLTGLAFFAFLFSAGMYIFALGDATKQETAKKNMTWTAIGVIAMVLVTFIIRFAGFISNTATQITDINNIPGI